MENTKSCFVIIGYGEKIDLATQRCLNLDSVFENIIKPAFESFEEPRFHCFRAIDENYGGLIDAQMYKWIYEADFVVADISTLNPNAIYELGIRHALRPYSTLVIAEDGIRELPFDINHVKIEKYKHLGDDVGVSEARRFINILRTKIQQMLKNQVCDSPVYTFIQKLQPPSFVLEEIKDIKQAIENANTEQPGTVAKKGEEVSLASLLGKAESFMKTRDYTRALELFKEAEKRDPANTVLKQKIVLATYKSEKPGKEKALEKAQSLLAKYFGSSQTVDPRTLELTATINKKLAELEYEKGENGTLDKALKWVYTAVNFFEKVYILSNRNYFTGGNLANVLLLAGVLEPGLHVKYRLLMRSCLAWQQVYDVTGKNIMAHNTVNFTSRNKQIVLEKFLQAKIILANGVEDTNYRELTAKLQAAQNQYDKKEFQERLDKSLKYNKLIRSSLENLPRNEMFI